MKKKVLTMLIGLSLLVTLVGCGAVKGVMKSGASAPETQAETTPVQMEEATDVSEEPLTAEAQPEPFVIPAYNGLPTETINGGVPFFTDEELSRSESFEDYAELDMLGRCGVAMACVTQETLPTEERGNISSVKPTGWQQEKYGNTWAYERCHLIAFCLTGENANPNNLVTGTHAFNQAMIPYEVEIAQDVERFNDHVLVRVTPCFEGDDLVCRGVLYEARSLLTDNIETCVFIHNVSEIFTIDYSTGETHPIVNVLVQSLRDKQVRNKEAFDQKMCAVSEKYSAADLPVYEMGYTP